MGGNDMVVQPGKSETLFTDSTSLAKSETKQDKADEKRRKKADKENIKEMKDAEESRWMQKVKRLRAISESEWQTAADADAEREESNNAAS